MPAAARIIVASSPTAASTPAGRSAAGVAPSPARLAADGCGRVEQLRVRRRWDRSRVRGRLGREVLVEVADDLDARAADRSTVRLFQAEATSSPGPSSRTRASVAARASRSGPTTARITRPQSSGTSGPSVPRTSLILRSSSHDG